MNTIYKYKLNLGYNKLEIPYTKVLSVMNRGGEVQLYATFNLDIDPRVLEVYVCGTGWNLDNKKEVLEWEFLDTVTDGVRVWHVFYKEGWEYGRK